MAEEPPIHSEQVEIQEAANEAYPDLRPRRNTLDELACIAGTLRSAVRRAPLTTVGAAVFLGILIGRRR